MDITTEPITVTCSDGFQIAATIFRPSKHGNGTAIVVSSGLAIPRGFYDKFCEYLADKGYAVVSYDYRGISESVSNSTRGRHMRMEDWGRLDLDAILAWVLDDIRPSRLFLIGHSAGGQLVGLAEHSEQLSGMVFFSCQTGYWGNFRIPVNFGVWLLWYVIMPSLSRGRDYFPARTVRLSKIDPPSGVALQWASWGRTKKYLFDDAHGIDIQRYRELSIPILVYSFPDDYLAPPKAVEALLAEYPRCKIDHRQVAPQQLGLKAIGHFGCFKETVRDTLWSELAEWLEEASLNLTSSGE